MGSCHRKTLQKVNGSLFPSELCKVDGCLSRWIICTVIRVEGMTSVYL